MKSDRKDCYQKVWLDIFNKKVKALQKSIQNEVNKIVNEIKEVQKE